MVRARSTVAPADRYPPSQGFDALDPGLTCVATALLALAAPFGYGWRRWQSPCIPPPITQRLALASRRPRRRRPHLPAAGNGRSDRRSLRQAVVLLHPGPSRPEGVRRQSRSRRLPLRRRPAEDVVRGSPPPPSPCGNLLREDVAAAAGSPPPPSGPRAAHSPQGDLALAVSRGKRRRREQKVRVRRMSPSPPLRRRAVGRSRLGSGAQSDPRLPLPGDRPQSRRRHVPSPSPPPRRPKAAAHPASGRERRRRASARSPRRSRLRAAGRNEMMARSFCCVYMPESRRNQRAGALKRAICTWAASPPLCASSGKPRRR